MQVFLPEKMSGLGYSRVSDLGEKETWLVGPGDEMQIDLFRQAVSLPRVAVSTTTNNIPPARRPAPGPWYDVVNGQILTHHPSVLAGVVVAPKNILLVERDVADLGHPDVAP